MVNETKEAEGRGLRAAPAGDERRTPDLVNPFVAVLVGIPCVAVAVTIALVVLDLALDMGNTHWVATAYPIAVAAAGAVYLYRRSLDPSDPVLVRLAFSAIGGAVSAGMLVAAVQVAIHMALVVICSGGGCG